ncbi:hypothetical protein KBD81_04895 [Candidatus Woesebacteria bacterium]|nr:hypothetical protein [Candidatus Woesebacteria bacterium]
MTETFVQKIGKQLTADAREVGTTLAAQTQSNDVKQALDHVIGATGRLVGMLEMQTEEDGIVSFSQAEAALDLTLGDILRFNGPQFEAFCAGEGLSNETYQVMYKYRTQMLARLQKALAGMVD